MQIQEIIIRIQSVNDSYAAYTVPVWCLINVDYCIGLPILAYLLAPSNCI